MNKTNKMTQKNKDIAKEYLKGKAKGDKISYASMARKYSFSEQWIRNIVQNYKLSLV